MSTDAQRQWYERNAERIAAERQVLRAQVLTFYGGVCECCHENEPRFLTLDHKNDDGTADRKGRGSGNAFYRTLLSEPRRDDLRVLCWNCNVGRTFDGVCPHEVTHA